MDNSTQEIMMLGSVIMDPRVIDECADTLEASHFSTAQNQKIYSSMLALRGAGRRVDAASIIATLEGLHNQSLVSYVFALDSSVATSAGWQLYRDRIVNAYRLREMHNSLRAARVAIEEASLDDPDQAIRDVSALVFAAAADSQASRLSHLSEAAEDAISGFASAAKSGGEPQGALTGFHELDSIIGGMKAGELFVLAGRPGMGKTTLGLNVALSVAMRAPVLFCSLEMSAPQLAGKVIASMSRQDLTRLSKGTASPGEVEKAIDAKLRSRGLPIWLLDDSLCSMDGISAKARQVQALAKNKLGLIVVDYLQLMTGKRAKNESREQQISQISRQLKVMARDLGVPVLALAQLNRGVEQRENKRPLLSDLRDSGAIEQDADQVWFVYREGYYRSEADQKKTEVIVAKNRRGQTSTVYLGFEGAQSRFCDWNEGLRWTG